MTNSQMESREPLDVNALADGLDQQNRTRAAARIVSHFSELRGEVEELGEKVATLQKLDARLTALEAKIAAIETQAQQKEKTHTPDDSKQPKKSDGISQANSERKAQRSRFPFAPF